MCTSTADMPTTIAVTRAGWMRFRAILIMSSSPSGQLPCGVIVPWATHATIHVRCARARGGLHRVQAPHPAAPCADLRHVYAPVPLLSRDGCAPGACEQDR